MTVPHRFKVFLVLCLAIAVPCMGFADGHMGHSSSRSSSILPGDFFIFPELTSYSRFDQEPKHKLANNEVIPGVNFFYTFDYKQFRFLGEWLFTTKSHNLERIQFGTHIGEASLWLGRFHNPIGYWNMQFHHGGILQSSISRPGIMAFETAGGALPNHLTGLLLEGIHEFEKAGLYYTLGVGAGPDLTNRLKPFNVIDPHGSHRPGVSARLGYQPISYGADEIGISAAYTELPGNGVSLNSGKQFIANIYANWQIDSLRFLSEVLYVNNRLDLPQTGKSSSDFVNAYGQLEWELHPNWTVYGRLEGTFGGKNDPYLALFPKFVEDRFMGGVRLKLPYNMALKLEASQDQLRDDRFSQVMVQWSAIFP